MHTPQKKTIFIAICLALALLCPVLSGADELYQYEDYAEAAIQRQTDYGYPPTDYAWVQPSDLATQETLLVLLVCLYENVKQQNLSEAKTLPEESALYDDHSSVDMEVRRRYMRKAFNAGFAVLDEDGAFETSYTVHVEDLTRTLSAFLSAMTDQTVSEAKALDWMETSANRHWGEIYQEDDSYFQTPISDLVSGELTNRRVYAIVDDLIDAYGWEM